ncbi:hotdog domain-containing protein [Psychrobacter sp. UBA3068]|jgi:acyl-CoA thioester hydrolase|uniref:hotdog domain-containing protein n=1 Tax=Psychrobacter sp. UBA3068 TaxID=1947349 RepID=UPI0039C97392
MTTPKSNPTNTVSISNKAQSDQTTTPLFATDYNVYINHTDAGGIVYHANHLVFFENCRRDWFTKLGLNGYFLQSDSGDIQHFVVSQADLQYKRAILLDEIINVRIDKVELKPASMVFYQSIHRHTPKGNSTDNTKNSRHLLSSARIVIACVQNQVTPESMSNDETQATRTAPMRPIRVPQSLRDAIQKAITQNADE